MLANQLQIRDIDAFPYQGHTFICNDIIGIADVQEVFDSALHAISVGKPVATGATRLVSVGSALREFPVLGITDQMPHYPRLWAHNVAVPLVPGLNKYCIVVTARLQGEGEFATTNGNTGPGGRASWWDVRLTGYSAAGIPTTQLINRFYQDPAYFTAARTTFPALGLPQQGTINLEGMPVDINWGALLPDEKFKQVVITGTVHSTLFTAANQENFGLVTFWLDYPLHPMGSVWSPSELNPNMGGTSVYVQPAPHPITGIDLYCDGIVDFQVYFYK